MSAAVVIKVQAFDEAALAPYARVIKPPAAAGERRFYSDALHDRPALAAPVFHVNHVPPAQLPLQATLLERHPHAAQCFVPLDVSRYLAVVMPSGADGAPLVDQAVAMHMPGNLGIIYLRGVWHLGAHVLDRTGHFSVLMWRGGQEPDDEFRTVPPFILQE